MKKRMASWIALAMILCVLAGCAEKVRIDSPEDRMFEDDVKAYIQELLDSTATVDSFEKKSSDRDDDELIVACSVSYSGEQGSNQGIFTLSYRSDGTKWILEKCKVDLESPPEPSAENPLEENQDIPADETSGNTQSQQSNTPTAPQPTKPVDAQPTETESTKKAYVKLDRKYIDDANFEGFAWPLYSEGSVGKTEIDWVSEDTSVATVDNAGVVYAVGEGTTVIRAEYNGEVLATCRIVCDFDTNVDEPQKPGNSGTKGNYAVYSHYGSALPYEEDKGVYSVTLSQNEWLGLYLMDPEKTGNTVEVVWGIVEGECEIDSDGAGVTATSAETCKIKATYNGETYYVIIY